LSSWQAHQAPLDKNVLPLSIDKQVISQNTIKHENKKIESKKEMSKAAVIGEDVDDLVSQQDAASREPGG